MENFTKVYNLSYHQELRFATAAEFGFTSGSEQGLTRI